MHVDDPLAYAGRAVIDLLALLALFPLQAMQAEEEAIFGLHYVLLCFVSPEAAQLHEVASISYRFGYCYRSR